MRKFSMIDFTTSVIDSVEIAQSIIADAENAAIAEMKAAAQTNCHRCQAGLTNFHLANPHADEIETETALRETWEYCADCQQEYFAHLENQAESANRSEAEAEELNADPFRFIREVPA